MDEPLKVIVPLAIALALVMGVSVFFVSQRMGFEDHPPDGPPPMPDERIWFQRGNTTQYDMVLWRSEFFVSGIWEAETFSIGMVNVSVFDVHGLQSDGTRTDYFDTDGDWTISVGDVFFVSGMTEAYNGGLLQVWHDEDDIGSVMISWDVGDRLIYTMILYWDYPIRETASGYDTTFKISWFHCDLDTNTTDLRFEVTDATGEPLPMTRVMYNDTNGDGLITLWDQVIVLDLPSDNYMGAIVRIFCGDTLIGVDSVPVWTIE
jgi:hypothetical protein